MSEYGTSSSPISQASESTNHKSPVGTGFPEAPSIYCLLTDIAGEGGPWDGWTVYALGV